MGGGAALDGCLVKVVPLASEDAAVGAPIADAATPSADGANASSDAPSRVVDASTPIADAGRVPGSDAPAADGTATGSPGGAGSVDLLVVLDDSASMGFSQGYAIGYVGYVVSGLLNQHGVNDVRVGVVTTDLGTPGSTVPGCAVSDGGDGAMLNPRVRGAATQTHPGPEISDAFCTPEVQAANFVTVRSTDDPMQQLWRGGCPMHVATTGCGLEQQLEAAYRALVTRGGPGGANEGFLRRDATLAILVVSDEDDGSARDCRYHDGVGACSDALDVYDASSTRWASPDLNLRFYDYTPASAQDPTWPLERYVDPARPLRGFLGLKPGHPERVVFGALTGVPVAVPQRTDGTTDWDRVLGPAAPGRPDDFVARDGQAAMTSPTDPSGPTSMRQRDPDPMCPSRMVPACRQNHTAPTSSCSSGDQYYAWRARRIAEVARRFDESALCAGGPCRNGMVASICDSDDVTPAARFAAIIGRRVGP